MCVGCLLYKPPKQNGPFCSVTVFLAKKSYMYCMLPYILKTQIQVSPTLNRNFYIKNWKITEHSIPGFITAKQNGILCSVIVFFLALRSYCILSYNLKSFIQLSPTLKSQFSPGKNLKKHQGCSVPFMGGGRLLEPGTECSVRNLPVPYVKSSI